MHTNEQSNAISMAWRVRETLNVELKTCELECDSNTKPITCVLFHVIFERVRYGRTKFCLILPHFFIVFSFNIKMYKILCHQS